MTTRMMIDACGWLGALLVLAAYIGLSTRRVTSDSISYQLANIAGATGIVFNSWWNGALPSVGLNLVWIVMGIYALFTRHRKAVQEQSAAESPRSMP